MFAMSGVFSLSGCLYSVLSSVFSLFFFHSSSIFPILFIHTYWSNLLLCDLCLHNSFSHALTF